MKLFKVEKTDLKHDGKFYNEGTVAKFDEESESVKKLVEAGILVESKEKVKAEDKKNDPTKTDDKDKK